MAPSKRKAEDDFILTISDNEDLPEEEIAPPPQKKAKKPGKKTTKPEANSRDGNDGDDGAMDPDFDFDLGEDKNHQSEDINSFSEFGPATSTMPRPKPILDRILQERSRKTQQELAGKTSKDTEGDDHEENGDNDLLEHDNEDEEDDEEVLAEDAFGMNVGSDVEESEDEDGKHNFKDEDGESDGGDGQDDDDAAASDDDSIATPVEHPDDDAEGSGSGSDDDDHEDVEEKAKRDAFFASQEKFKSGNKDKAGTFTTMSLSRPILRGLALSGFTTPTPVQAKAIPIALMGSDLVAGAATGSGKTAAFVVPILERLFYRPKKIPATRVVVLTPTRELAIQCHSVFAKLARCTDITFCLAVGGLSLKSQEAELRLRPDVVIATPGRFIDHMRNSAGFTVDAIEILVLDEADRMLEDGFTTELNEILQEMPKRRQSMLFSATMNSSVNNLIRIGMNKPVSIMVDSQNSTVNTLVQQFVRLRGNEHMRFGYLLHICNKMYTSGAIIFFSKKSDAHRARVILDLLGLSALELHGDLNQTERVANIEAFRTGQVSFLLATNLAARGIDIRGVDTVINFDAPKDLSVYLHRVGRTARAGRTGTAITLIAEADRKLVKAAKRAGKVQETESKSVNIRAELAAEWQAKVDKLEGEVDEILAEEKERKQLQRAEMEITKGENLIKHADEIKSRPKRTWHETEQDKKKAKQPARPSVDVLREKLKKKRPNGKLSNKDKKKLDNKAERQKGRLWKKGAADREGKGGEKVRKRGKKD